MKFSVQFNYHGLHRIICQDEAGTHTGEWASYRSLAILQHRGKTYVEGSSYGLLPTSELVYELTSHATKLDSAQEYIDAEGRDRRAEVK